MVGRKGRGLGRQFPDSEEDLWTKRHLAVSRKRHWDSDLLHKSWARIGLLFEALRPARITHHMGSSQV